VCEHPPFFACTDCDIDCSVAASECDDSDSQQVVLLSVIGSDQLLPVTMINQHASVIVTEVRSNTCVLFVTVTDCHTIMMAVSYIEFKSHLCVSKCH